MKIRFRQKILLIAAAILVHFTASASPVDGDSVTIVVKPQNVYIEEMDFNNHLNFDFILTNNTGSELLVRNIEISVFDENGRLARRDFVNPFQRESLEFYPQAIEAKSSILIYNPFHSFEKNIPLNKLYYEFSFSSEDRMIRYKTTCVVSPVVYKPKTNLIFPVKGRVLVWDGHDYSSHHRRLNYTNSFFKKRGTESNYQRYGYDFVVVDETGTMYRGAPKNPEDWYSRKPDNNEDYYGFGTTVYAAGAGRIADVHDGEPDNRSYNEAEIATREKAYGGNYVIIDHLNGEYSWFGHLKQGSIKVKEGQLVKQGAIIGAMGASGSSLFPHLHYELRNGSGANHVEGLPSYFSRFSKVLGSKKITVKRGQVDSGDIVESH